MIGGEINSNKFSAVALTPVISFCGLYGIKDSFKMARDEREVARLQMI